MARFALDGRPFLVKAIAAVAHSSGRTDTRFARRVDAASTPRSAGRCIDQRRSRLRRIVVLTTAILATSSHRGQCQEDDLARELPRIQPRERPRH